MEERAMIASQIEANTALIASLNGQLEVRRKNLQLETENLQARVDELNRARRHWEVASSYLTEISPIATTLEATLLHLKKEDAGAASAPESTDAIEVDFIPDGDLSMKTFGSDLMSHVNGALQTFIAAARNAEAAYFAATEGHQLAILQHELAKNSTRTIQDLIKGVNEANELEERALKIRTMWKLPAEIWGQVFTEAVLPDSGLSTRDTRMPGGWMHGSRAMILASVCQEWRQLAIQQKSLWVTINCTEPQGYDLILPTGLYLERKGALPYTLVLLMDSGGAWWSQAMLERNFLHRMDKLHRLHLFVHKEGQELVRRIYSRLPSAVELVIEADIPSNIPVESITPGLVPLVGFALPPLPELKRLVIHFTGTPIYATPPSLTSR